MFRYLLPKDGSVFDGLEHAEVVYAKNQPEYLPLRCLVSEGPEKRVVSRWTLTDEQRKAIAEGADIFLMLLTFGSPLQPIQIATGSGDEDLDWVEKALLDQWEPFIEKPAPVNGMDSVENRFPEQFDNPYGVIDHE